MSTLPLFPLNAVAFPGAVMPLHVFEERYKGLIQHLLTLRDSDQQFGIVLIREGYEVGERGNQSLMRIGCRVQASDISTNEDGSYDIAAIGRDRFRITSIDGSHGFPVGEVETLPTPREDVAATVTDEVRALFTAYNAVRAEIGTESVETPDVKDPEMLSWLLAARVALSLRDRQTLLETDSAAARLELIGQLLRLELEAMNVIPSLPAVGLARSGWSPN